MGREDDLTRISDINIPSYEILDLREEGNNASGQRVPSTRVSLPTISGGTAEYSPGRALGSGGDQSCQPFQASGE